MDKKYEPVRLEDINFLNAKSLVIATIFFFFTLLSSTSAQVHLSLEAAKEILISNSSPIKQAELREKIARIDLAQAYDALTPNLGFTVNNQNTMGLMFDQITGQLITGNRWSHYANANLTSGLTLFQGFRGINAIRLSRVNLDLSRLDTEKLKHELQIQLISLFYQTLINYDLYNVSLEQTKLSEQLVKTEEIKLNNGKSTLLDIAQAKNKLADDRLNATNTKNAYNLGLFKLKQLLELENNSELKLVEPEGVHIDTISMLELYVVSVNDPYLKSINRRIDQQILNTQIAKAGYFPTIGLNSSYGTNYSSQRFASAFSKTTMPVVDQMNNNRSLYINLTLSYNIFDNFNTKSNVAKARINTENLQFERDKIMRDRQQSLLQIRLEYQAALEENKAIISSYETNKMNYEAMLERFEVGKNSSIDLFRAMTDFNMAEFRLITSKYSLKLKEELLKLHLEL